MAWETQGPILDRTHERLAASDRGVVMYREMLAREIKKVQQESDPMNVFRDPESRDHRYQDGQALWKSGRRDRCATTCRRHYRGKLSCSRGNRSSRSNRGHPVLAFTVAARIDCEAIGSIHYHYMGARTPSELPMPRNPNPIGNASGRRSSKARKREGEVRLWGEQEITHPDIIAAFTKEFPFVKAVSVSGRVGDLMPRIIAERRAGKFLADIYSGGLGGRSFFDFHKAGVLDPLKPMLLCCPMSSTAPNG